MYMWQLSVTYNSRGYNIQTSFLWTFQIIVIEESLYQSPFLKCVVTTPTGAQYKGLKYQKGNCGVSIVRSGEDMEQVQRSQCFIETKSCKMYIYLYTYAINAIYFYRVLGIAVVVSELVRSQLKVMQIHMKLEQFMLSSLMIYLRGKSC